MYQRHIISFSHHKQARAKEVKIPHPESDRVEDSTPSHKFKVTMSPLCQLCVSG